MEIGHEDVLLLCIVMELCQRGLDDDHVDISSIKIQKFSLAQLHIGIYLIHLGVVEEEAHLFLALLIGYHLHTGVYIGQFYGISADTSIGIEDYLGSIAFTGNILRYLFRRVDSPRILIYLYPLIELLKENVSLFPMFVELVLAVLLLLDFLIALFLAADFLLQQGDADGHVDSRDLDQQLSVLEAGGEEEVFWQSADGAFSLVILGHAMIVPQLNIDGLSEVPMVQFGLPLKQGFLLLIFLLELQTIFSLGIPPWDVLVAPEGLFHLVILVGVVGLAGPRVSRGVDCS